MGTFHSENAYRHKLQNKRKYLSRLKHCLTEDEYNLIEGVELVSDERKVRQSLLISASKEHSDKLPIFDILGEYVSQQRKIIIYSLAIAKFSLDFIVSYFPTLEVFGYYILRKQNVPKLKKNFSFTHYVAAFHGTNFFFSLPFIIALRGMSNKARKTKRSISCNPSDVEYAINRVWLSQLFRSPDEKTWVEHMRDVMPPHLKKSGTKTWQVTPVLKKIFPTIQRTVFDLVVAHELGHAVVDILKINAENKEGEEAVANLFAFCLFPKFRHKLIMLLMSSLQPDDYRKWFALYKHIVSKLLLKAMNLAVAGVPKKLFVSARFIPICEDTKVLKCFMHEKRSASCSSFVTP